MKPHTALEKGEQSMERKPSSRSKQKSLSPVQSALLQDEIESASRLQAKTKAGLKKWGKNWQDMVRTGRRFTRVERIEPVTADAEVTYILRPEPGWEWRCQNCKEYSLIKESDIPAVLKEWEELAAKTVAHGFKPPVKPTPETAGCPNCKYRPGAPE